MFGAWPRLAKLSAVWLVAALLAEAASFVCNFGIQRVVLRTRGWFAVVAAGLTGNMVTNVLPGGYAAGAAVQFRMLERAGINPDAAAGGLTASSLLGVGGLLMLPILTLPAVLGGSHVNHALVNTAVIGVAGFVVYVGLGILLLETDRPLGFVGRGAQWIWNKVRRHHAPMTGLDGRLLTQRDQIRGALGREWKQVLLLEVGRLGFDFLCLLAALRATGSQPHPWLVLLAYSAAGVIALIPATPGGLGIVEASLSGLLVLAGVERPQRCVSHAGLPVSRVLASHGRWARCLLALPPAIRTGSVQRTDQPLIRQPCRAASRRTTWPAAAARRGLGAGAGGRRRPAGGPRPRCRRT